jgi:DNA-binding transcriptional regulator YhcF (GntR family)
MPTQRHQPQVVNLPKYQQAAALVREQVVDGVLAPGAPAPSAAALARITGYSALTCRRALRALVADGTLAEGATQAARLRVPGASSGQTPDQAKRALSRAMAARRRAAGLTQPQLAGLIGMSTTAVGHAETGRVWQGRPFWELADKVLSAGGELLRLHDAVQAAQLPPEPADGTGPAPPAPEASPAAPPPAVTAGVPGPVTCITITWAGGATTTVYPPGGLPARRPAPATRQAEPR